MARYTGPVCRLCRREGTKLFLKGASCYSKKCAVRAPPHAARPARRAPPQGCPSSASSCARSRRSAASTASSSASSGRYFDEAESPPRRDRREPAPPARDAPRQRRLPDGLRGQPRPGPPARQPRPLHWSTAAGTTWPATDFAPATASRSASASRKSTATFKTARETLRAAQVPEWLSVDAGQAGRQRDRAAAPRPDAGRAQRAARGRVLLEVVADDDRTGEPRRSSRSGIPTGTVRQVRGQPAAGRLRRDARQCPAARAAVVARGRRRDLHPGPRRLPRVQHHARASRRT